MANDGGTTDTSAPIASLEPLQVTGVTEVTVGGAAWLIALIVCLVMREQLAASGRGDWVGICGAGVVLSVLGRIYVERRIKRLGLTRD